MDLGWNSFENTEDTPVSIYTQMGTRSISIGIMVLVLVAEFHELSTCLLIHDNGVFENYLCMHKNMYVCRPVHKYVYMYAHVHAYVYLSLQRHQDSI